MRTSDVSVGRTGPVYSPAVVRRVHAAVVLAAPAIGHLVRLVRTTSGFGRFRLHVWPQSQTL